MDMDEPIKVWRKAGFTLRLWDTGTYDRRGCTRLRYQLKDGQRVIFEGANYCASPLHADDSRETVAGLLGFLTLKPGDTDREYFDNYTPAQMDWTRSSRCDYLGMLQYDMENMDK